MRIAFITRSTLYDVPGGDTIQTLETVKHLNASGVEATIYRTHEKIDYAAYDLLHFSNITRPADILFHTRQTTQPFVLSPVFVDYSEYDRYYRQGLSGWVLRQFPAGTNEYIKTISRWLAGKDKLRSPDYIRKGQQKSIKEILQKAACLLPGSEAEYRRLKEVYGIEKKYCVVPNGIDPSLFYPGQKASKDNRLVLCAARIEGIKNQLNLVKALNDTDYTLLLIGSPAPNQKKYYHDCRKIASKNIVFLDRVSQEVLIDFYKKAKVHALPSWFETCGLSTLEAAAMGCNPVITDKGYTRDYFGDAAFYCDPGDPASIFQAIEKAAQSDASTALQQKILRNYTWQQAAALTLQACQNILHAKTADRHHGHKRHSQPVWGL